MTYQTKTFNGKQYTLAGEAERNSPELDKIYNNAVAEGYDVFIGASHRRGEHGEIIFMVWKSKSKK